MIDNHPCDQPDIILNELNKQFASIGSNTSVGCGIDYLGLDHMFELNQFKFSNTNDQEILNVIHSLKNNVSPGLDKISTKLVKSTAIQLAPVLAECFNNMISTRVYPNILKRVKTFPIFKGGDSNNLNNYRFICVVPTFSKIFEYIMLHQMLEYIETNKLISRKQFGFMPKSNTTIACIEFVDSLQKNLDNGRFCGCISVDIHKAFDSISHDILLNKLADFGFSQQAISLIHSYLEKRQQLMQAEGSSSDWQLRNCGVPQGSVLGPLLYLIFINDAFSLNLKGSLSMYADDSMLQYSASNIDTLMNDMQDDIEKLNQYFKTNGLEINQKKTVYMLFKKSCVYKERFNLKIHDKPLQYACSIKYLGLYIDEKLNWSSHIENIKKKLLPILNILFRLRSIVDKEILFNIYFAHFYSHLLYLNSIWSGSANYLISPLKVLQNKALKIITGQPRLTPSHSLYSTNLLPVDVLNKYELIMIFKKIEDGHIRSSFKLTKNYEIHQHNTRGADCIHLLSINSTYFGLKSVYYRGSSLYNAIPANIKEINSLSQFKKELKAFLYVDYMKNHR